ncbi:MAG: helix-turn-helix domain-containing protein [Thermoleophilaceae bacterium]
MEAANLESSLRRGLSLEAIGRLTGRHPSTVGYWVKQHGLAAVHRNRHAPRGGIDRDTLAALVEEGLSTREIAERIGFSQSTVRHWLRKHGLRTHRARRDNSGGVRGVHPDRVPLDCARHGVTDFWLEARGIYRCLRCRSEAVARRRRRLKEILVAEAGGACCICGYDRHIGALQFHHRADEVKEFGLSDRGLTRSLEAVRAEASKCVLLCANCHSEVEAGIVKVT